ncbi:MAG: hypothetical protein II837_01300, partial [Treponema sp.]|nr:hypothetical protein [Treponema sp.]
MHEGFANLVCNGLCSLMETLIKDRILPLYPSGTKNLEILAEKSAALSFSAPSGACGMGFPQGF